MHLPIRLAAGSALEDDRRYEEGIQAQIRNIEAAYGKPMSQVLAIVSASGLTKHNEVVSMLTRGRRQLSARCTTP
jgi:Domain of unknown function (DUF4287)